MDYLREGIHLRGFAQIEPLVAYKNEAFDLFRDLMNSIWGDFARLIFHVEVTRRGRTAARPSSAPAPRRAPRRSSPTGGGRVTYSGGAARHRARWRCAAAGGAGRRRRTPRGGDGRRSTSSSAASTGEQIGRNDPCWCGSGKKFKKCHGA